MPTWTPRHCWRTWVSDDFRQFDIDNLHLIDSYAYDIPANWKVCVDAFLENYHFQAVHAGTVGVPGANSAVNHYGSVMSLFEHGNARGILPWNEGFERGVKEDFDMGFEGIPDIPTTGEIARNYVLAYNIFPNLVTPTFSNGIPLGLYWPTSINTTRFEVHWLAPRPETDAIKEAWKVKIDAYNQVLDEDLTFLPSVQKSNESPAFISIPLNYQERRIYHLHEHIDKTIGENKIPGELRVQPVLAPFIEKQEDKGVQPGIEEKITDS